jgi:AraC-like DNA-binding protein
LILFGHNFDLRWPKSKVEEMRPQFERVTFPAGCSIRVYKREIAEIPFEWHHHPEYELTLTLNSRGWRFIGDHIGPYTSKDLVLIPPDMPHTWASSSTLDQAHPHTAVVIWFTGEWARRLADVCPEFSALRKLLNRANGALNFSEHAAANVESRLADLLSSSPTNRLQAALATLTELASAEATSLATAQSGATLVPSDQAVQLNRILNLVHKRFTEPLRVADLCSAGNVSARSLHRLFIRHVGENLSRYLARLRIGRASMLLVESDRSIRAIALEAGFVNLANFNRQFRAARQMTPREFRRYYLEHGRLPDPAGANDLTKRSPSLEVGRGR